MQRRYGRNADVCTCRYDRRAQQRKRVVDVYHVRLLGTQMVREFRPDRAVPGYTQGNRGSIEQGHRDDIITAPLERVNPVPGSRE
jgi:hypothetical protein